jgi:hypothetical protein
MAMLVRLVEQVFLEQATAMLKHLAVVEVAVEVPLTQTSWAVVAVVLVQLELVAPLLMAAIQEVIMLGILLLQVVRLLRLML